MRWPYPQTSRLQTILASVFVSILIGGYSAPSASAQDLRDVRRQKAAAQAELDRLVGRYHSAESQLGSVEGQIRRAEQRLADSENNLKGLRSHLNKKADAAYRAGPGGILGVLLSSSTPVQFFRRMALLERAASGDQEEIVKTSRLRSETHDERALLSERRDEQRQVVASMRRQSAELNAKLLKTAAQQRELEAQQSERERRAKEALARERSQRQAAIVAQKAFSKDSVQMAVGSGGGSMACPVNGPRSYRDTWGDPRPGGRRHKGTDIFAASGTPTVAPAAGSISRKQRGGAGGIMLWFKADGGTEYFYAHLSGYASGTDVGKSVAAGSTVGYVGNSGTSGGPQHLHFEIHPGGGAPINPYSAVRAACG